MNKKTTGPKKATTKTAKAVKSAKSVKSATTAAKEENAVMSYGQVRALTNALYHAKKTKAEMSECIDKAMKATGLTRESTFTEEKKQAWLNEHGNEPATYGQCQMFAMVLYNAKTAYSTISAKIEQLDKENGYVRAPKAEEKSVEQVVEEANSEEAKKAPKAKATKKSQAQA